MLFKEEFITCKDNIITVIILLTTLPTRSHITYVYSTNKGNRVCYVESQGPGPRSTSYQQ